MSKQHHFVVWWDTDLQAWEIGHARYDEDEPLYDTETNEWGELHGEDARLDNQLVDDLSRRLHTGTIHPYLDNRR